MDKTKILSFDEGFEFLGYFFDKNGKAIPHKAENQLVDRLEAVWLDSKFKNIESRLAKGREILTGWEQYYREERELGSILEYVVYASILIGRNQFDAQKMGQKRSLFENPYKDVTEYLAGIWKKKERLELQLLEYEQFQQIYDAEERITDFSDPMVLELLQAHEKYFVLPEEEGKTELIQIYSDLKQYRKAEKLMGKEKQKPAVGDVRLDLNGISVDYSFTANEIQEYMEFFVGREDLYATDSVGFDGRRKKEDVLAPLVPEIVKRHLLGEEVIGTYLQRTNATVKYVVFDIDVSKKILLKNPDEEMLKIYIEKTFQAALKIVKELRHVGLNGYIEFSGYRGYHVWVFFEEWLQVRYAQLLSDIVEKWMVENTRDGDIQIECFPNKTRVNQGKRGQSIKLPMGVHPRNHQRSIFFDYEFQVYEKQSEALRDFVKCSSMAVKKAISSCNAMEEKDGETRLEVDTDLEGFGNIPEAVKVVLQSCNLIRYLCQKARTTHYLSHFERLTVLYVFGHLGDEGKDFVHKVMSFTLNYSHQTTQKFINKCPEKPISCLKLRDQYRQISAEIGCSCAFKRSKDCYPSPVLHALKNAEDTSQITIPMSKTVTEQKQELIKEEISLPMNLQSIIEKIMDLRKQSRAIGKSIQKYENELSDIFDENHTDSIEIKQGMLTRRRVGENVEWIIEL